MGRIFAAICPKDGKAAGVRREMRPPDSFLIRFTLPQCNTQAMNLHLAGISGRVAPENIWQFIRDNWRSNRIFTDQGDIVDQCCNAWNRLTDRPSRLTSIGMRDWVHGL